MLPLINSLATLFLLLIGAQDFKQREISWVLIPLTFLALLFIGIETISSYDLLKYTLLNLSFVTIQLVLLTVYMSLKDKKITNILHKHIGLGDLLFFVVLCVGFSPVNFILFFISSMIATLLGFIIYTLFSFKKEFKEIPLAGAMAGILVITLFINDSITHLNLYDDAYFLNMING